MLARGRRARYRGGLRSTGAAVNRAGTGQQAESRVVWRRMRQRNPGGKRCAVAWERIQQKGNVVVGLLMVQA